MIYEITTSSESETRALGERLGKALKGDETISLVGDLGAGKTQLVKGLATGVGSTARVTSPTFVLQRSYEGKQGKLINHFDAYRISAPEFANLGILDWIGQTINVIEWGGLVAQVLPDDTIEITIKVVDDTTRKITIKYDQVRSYIAARLK